MAIEDTIEDVASEPVDVTVDGVRVRKRGIRDLIDADKYLEAKTQRDKATFPVKRFVGVPPGSV